MKCSDSCNNVVQNNRTKTAWNLLDMICMLLARFTDNHIEPNINHSTRVTSWTGLLSLNKYPGIYVCRQSSIQESGTRQGLLPQAPYRLPLLKAALDFWRLWHLQEAPQLIVRWSTTWEWYNEQEHDSSVTGPMVKIGRIGEFWTSVLWPWKPDTEQLRRKWPRPGLVLSKDEVPRWSTYGVAYLLLSRWEHLDGGRKTHDSNLAILFSNICGSGPQHHAWPWWSHTSG
jgi:hypothetical protein